MLYRVSFYQNIQTFIIMALCKLNNFILIHIFRSKLIYNNFLPDKAYEKLDCTKKTLNAHPKTSNAANCTHQRTPLTFFSHGITFVRQLITLSAEISSSKLRNLKSQREQVDWLVCAGFQFSYHPPFWVMWLGSRPSVGGSESSRRDSITAWFKRYFCQFTCVFPAWKTFCTSVNIRSRSTKITRKPSCL